MAKALQSDQATTAATAMSIDPNATLPNQLPNCNADQVLTNNPVTGPACVQVATGAAGFANKAYLNTNGQSWTVPDGVFTMRLTGAAGATLQARPTYQQTGTQPNGTSTASCVSLYMYDGNPGGYYTVGDPGNTYWYRIACPSGYSFSSNYTVGQDCNDGGGSGSCTGFYRNAGTAWKQNYSPIYGCVPANTYGSGSSGNKTVSVTPGQIISVAISSQGVAVSGGPPQCPWSDTIYSVITSSPTDSIHSDLSTGEQPGEASVSSAGILEW